MRTEFYEEITPLSFQNKGIVSTLNNFLFRNFVSDIHAKTGQILNRGSAQQIGGSVGGGYDNTIALKVIMAIQ